MKQCNVLLGLLTKQFLPTSLVTAVIIALVFVKFYYSDIYAKKVYYISKFRQNVINHMTTEYCQSSQ